MLPLLDSGFTASMALRRTGVASMGFLAKLDLPLRDTGDIQEVVDEMGEVVDLAADDLPAPLEVLDAAGELGDGDGVADSRERIPQLMGEHGQELVLLEIGLFEGRRPLLEGFFQVLLLGRVADDFEEPSRLARYRPSAA